MANENLPACPFCGVLPIKDKKSSANGYRIPHKKGCLIEHYFARIQEGAVDKWRKRVTKRPCGLAAPGRVTVKTYSCGVLNCGDGECIHKLLDEICPHCGNNMVLVTTTGHKFCASHESSCEYEIFTNS